jgi:hypothetical protein
LCNPLLSRFIVVNIPQYTDEEFKEFYITPNATAYNG